MTEEEFQSDLSLALARDSPVLMTGDGEQTEVLARQIHHGSGVAAVLLWLPTVAARLGC